MKAHIYSTTLKLKCAIGPYVFYFLTRPDYENILVLALRLPGFLGFFFNPSPYLHFTPVKVGVK